MVIDARQLIRRSSSGSVKQNTRCTRLPGAQRVHPDYANPARLSNQMDELRGSSEVDPGRIAVPEMGSHRNLIRLLTVNGHCSKFLGVRIDSEKLAQSRLPITGRCAARALPIAHGK